MRTVSVSKPQHSGKFGQILPDNGNIFICYYLFDLGFRFVFISNIEGSTALILDIDKSFKCATTKMRTVSVFKPALAQHCGRFG